VLDYSVNGIGLQCRGHVQVDDEILLLPTGDLMAPARYLYKVVNVRQSADQTRIVGALFVRIEQRGMAKLPQEQVG
jgi:hypothetical protein